MSRPLARLAAAAAAAAVALAAVLVPTAPARAVGEAYTVDTTATAATLMESPTGSSTTFTLVLGAAPVGGDVLVDLGSTDTTECTASPAQHLFTAANWSTPVTVTIASVDDMVADGTQPCAVTITRNAASTDTNYGVVPNPPNVSLNILDNETPGITVGTPSGSLNEGGGSATFTLTANTVPIGDVSLPITTFGAQCEIDTGTGFSSMETVTLPAGSTTAVVITVRAVNDPIVEGAHLCLVATGNPTSATDAFYDALSAIDVGDVSVNIVDDDPAELDIDTSATAATLSESGGSTTLAVALSGEPSSGMVVLDIATSDATECSASPSTLSFNPTDWSVPQVVTLTALTDGVADGDQLCAPVITLGAATTSAGYVGATFAAIAALRVLDVDAAAAGGGGALATSGVTPGLAPGLAATLLLLGAALMLAAYRREAAPR